MTDAHLDGYYYKPRIDREHLAQYSEGLDRPVGLPQRRDRRGPLETDDWELARKLAGEYGDIFGKDGFFLELQDHGLPEQRRLNEQLLRLAPGGRRCRWSSPTTCTTSTRPSPRPTTSCSASARATTSTRRAG